MKSAIKDIFSWSKSGLNLVLGLRKDVMLSFFLLFSAIELLEASLRFLSSLFFYNHG